MEKVWPVEFVPNTVSSVPHEPKLEDDETTSELSDHSDEQTTSSTSDDSDDQTTSSNKSDDDDQIRHSLFFDLEGKSKVAPFLVENNSKNVHIKTYNISDDSDDQTTNNKSDDSDDQTTSNKSDDPDDQTASNKNDDPDDQTASNKSDDSERRSCYLSAIGDRSLYVQRFAFDPETDLRCADERFTFPDFCNDDGFFGGLVVAPSEKDKLMIKPRSWFKRAVTVETMHISCKSDTYQPGHNYAGVIIYQYNGKSEWKTANNTHCKTGYIVIQNTDSENVGRLTREEPGMVHGAVYRNAFAEPVKKSVVGEGFAIHDGEIKFNSGVFNNPQGSAFHDHRKRMHELSEHCVKKIVRHRMNEGSSWIEKRNFEIKELLEDCAYIPDYNPYGHNNKRSCNIM